MGGNIVIDAKDGDIILKGLNIRIEGQDGSGEVTITAPKQIQERPRCQHQGIKSKYGGNK